MGAAGADWSCGSSEGSKEKYEELHCEMYVRKADADRAGSTLSGDNINLNTNGLAAIAPDGNPNHGSGAATWTFQ